MGKLLSFIMFFSLSLLSAQPPTLEVPKMLQEIGVNSTSYNQAVNKIWLRICRENEINLQDYHSIKPGDKLLLPDGSYYTVLPGEHPWRAAEYATIEWYLEANRQPKSKPNYRFWLPGLLTIFFFLVAWAQIKRSKRKKRAKTLEEALRKNNMPL